MNLVRRATALGKVVLYFVAEIASGLFSLLSGGRRALRRVTDSFTACSA